ncbi:hypothetical protein KKA95_02220 [Patescibacteria group bacterium]|nr:hypothetical protein [Patescibacteria group bacterium]
MMLASKKGIMLKFLITLLLAILIVFIPACLIGSAFFRLSDQAKDNFADLTAEIINVQESSIPITRSIVFIQDEDTYLYFVTDITRGQRIEYDEENYLLDHSLECEGINCLCLCRDYTTEYENEDLSGESWRVCTQRVCKELPGVEISYGTEKLVYRGDDDSRRQTARIIRCVANTPYCRGNEGDLSIIFSRLDTEGAYDAIK